VEVVVYRRQVLCLCGVAVETDHCLGNAAGRSVEGCGIQTRRRFPRLHEVSEDPEDLRRFGDDGDDLHGAVTASTAERIRVVDLLDQTGPGGAALLG
jgi:hypothetical protein